jgi:hypothetical protein
MAAQMEVMYRELDVLQEVVNAACAGQEVPDEICQLPANVYMTSKMKSTRLPTK